MPENVYIVRENVMLRGEFAGNVFNTQHIFTAKLKNNKKEGE